MPTGYTSNIYNGKEVSMADFLFGCAREMMPLVIMRDEPMDAPIPDEFKPVDYHLKELNKSRSELKKYQAMSDEDYAKDSSVRLEEHNKDNQRRNKEADNLRKRYQSIKDSVMAWNPPTDDHKPLKEYAIEQLDSSINFDTKHYDWPFKNKTRQENIESLLKDVDYHTAENAKEIERAVWRTNWVQKLKQSLQ